MTPPDFPRTALDGSVIDRFRTICADHTKSLAIDDGAKRLSYGDVLARAEAMARGLYAALPPGDDPVAIALPHGALFPVAMLGVLMTGRAYVPLDLDFPMARNRAVLSHAQPAAVLTDTANYRLAADLAPPGTPVLSVEDLTDGPLPPPPTARSLAYIIYTSGTTGEPKGVMQDHGNLLHDVLQYSHAVRLRPDDRLTQLYSASVNGAIRDIYGALLNGASLHVLSVKRLGAAGLVEAMQSRRITIYHSVPVVLRQVVAVRQPLDTVRLGYVAGDRFDSADADSFRRTFPQAELYTGIGSTENATLYRHWIVPRNFIAAGPRLPVGYAVPERDVELIGEDAQPVAEGETGEIVVTSRYMALGYWRAPEMSAQEFTPSLNDPLARRFATGDLGRLRPDGLLEHMGRKDAQVKIRGYRVEPAEVEAIIKTLPPVQEAAVVVRYDADTASLTLWWTAKPGFEDIDLAQLIRAALPSHMVPADRVRVAQLPLLANDKIDRAVLARREAARPLSDRPRWNDPVTQRVADIYRDVLGCDAQDLNDADSLQRVQIVLAIEVAFGVRLPPVFFQDGPTTGGSTLAVAEWLKGVAA